VPVIKKQAISAYDPRVIEGTGITMMATAQGADHTAGNLARLKSRDMSLEQLLEASLKVQTQCATSDSIGLCIFGRTVTDAQYPFLAEAANAAHATSITPEFFPQLGREVLKLEWEFNQKAGFGAADDELPEFFYSEPLPPANQAARFHGQDVYGMYNRLP
jgi:aldehyde:ferredoxin oxidoreductase